MLLDEHRWRAAALSERATAAGFVVAAPVWQPAADGTPPTIGRIGRYIETTMHRRGVESLAAHLADDHRLQQPSLHELDVGVFEVGCADGRRRIARLFPPARSQEAVERDAELLAELDHAGFPVERLAQPVAVSRHAGQGVLLTELVSGRHQTTNPDGFRLLGELLGRLHSLGADWEARAGGASASPCAPGRRAGARARRHARAARGSAAARVRGRCRGIHHTCPAAGQCR